jgi:hypothetical protein
MADAGTWWVRAVDGVSDDLEVVSAPRLPVGILFGALGRPPSASSGSRQVTPIESGFLVRIKGRLVS